MIRSWVLGAGGPCPWELPVFWWGKRTWQEMSDTVQRQSKGLGTWKKGPPTLAGRKEGFRGEEWHSNIRSSWGRAEASWRQRRYCQPASRLLYVALSQGGSGSGGWRAAQSIPAVFLRLTLNFMRALNPPLFWSPQPNCAIQLTLLEFSSSILYLLNTFFIPSKYVV